MLSPKSFHRLPQISSLALCAVVWLIAPGVRAQRALGPDATEAAQLDEAREVRLTMALAMNRALEHSPDVQVAMVRLSAAESYRAFQEMPVIGNPQLSVRAMLGVPDAPAATYAGVIGLPFDLSSRQGRWSEEASLLIDVAEFELSRARNDARRDALTRFVEAATRHLNVEIAEARLQTAETLLQNMQARSRAGAATALDLSLAQSELGQAHAEVLEQKRLEVQAQDALRQILDLDPRAVLSLEALDAPSSRDVNLDAVIARARENRAEPLALAAEARRFGVSEHRLYAEAMDPLTLQVEYEAQGNQNTNSSFGFGASYGLPLFRTNQGERAVARAQSQSTQVEANIEERRVQREAAAALRQLRLITEQLAALDSEAIPAGEQSLQLVETLLEQGAVDLYRVLLARRELFALRERRVEVLREAWSARVDLERAVGGEIE